MSFFIRSAVILTSLAFALPSAAQEKPSIAVIPFTGSTGNMRLDGMGPAMAEYVRTELAGYEQFASVVSAPAAGNAAALTAEQAAAAAAAAGGARFVVTGSFSGSARMMTITARTYDTVSERWFTETVAGSYKKQYHKMVEILGYNVRHALTGAGGYISTYQLHPGWYASMAISSGVALFTSGVMYALYRDSYDNMYMAEDQSLADIEANYQKANSSFRASAIFAWTGVALTSVTTYLLVSSYRKTNFITGSHGNGDPPLSFVPTPDGGKLTYTVRF